MQNVHGIDHTYYSCPQWSSSCSVRCLCVLNVVSQLSQGGDVLLGMLNYGVQGHFVCKMLMALITFIIAICDRVAHVVLDDISVWSSVYSVWRRNVFMGSK